jgi:hypothetical protein
MASAIREIEKIDSEVECVSADGKLYVVVVGKGRKKTKDQIAAVLSGNNRSESGGRWGDCYAEFAFEIVSTKDKIPSSSTLPDGTAPSDARRKKKRIPKRYRK